MERFGNMQDRLFTIHQVADLLATTHREVLHWIAKGWLASKPGLDGADRVSEKGLIHFLKGRGIDIMQLMDSTAVPYAGRPEGAGSGPQVPAAAAAAANDRPADHGTDLSRPPAQKANPMATSADDAELLDLDEETARGPRPRVLSACDGPAGPSLDEEVANALAAREMLTGKHVPAESNEPAPLPSLDLAPPRQPRPAAPTSAPAAPTSAPAAPEAPATTPSPATPAASARAALPAPAPTADAKEPAAAMPAAPPTSPSPATPAASARGTNTSVSPTASSAASA
jgi:hypothetical protein